MRDREKRALATAGSLLLLTPLVAACGDEGATPPRTPTGADQRARGEGGASLTLPDGTRVEVRCADRSGRRVLSERHRPSGGDWSRPRKLHASDQEACQEVELASSQGTVAVNADFGPPTGVGQPPEETLAAVGAEGLDEWRTRLVKDSDGWDRVNVSDGGGTAAFLAYTEKTVTTLWWTRDDGFTGPRTRKRPPKRLDRDFHGSWKTGDGSWRLAVQPRGRGGVATFFRADGTECVVRVALWPNSRRVGEFTEVHRDRGSYSPKCPGWSTDDFVKLNAEGDALTFQVSRLRFTRTEPDSRERKLPEPPGPVPALDRAWRGEWRPKDGGPKVTLTEERPGHPRATFTDRRGGTCVVRVELFVAHVDLLTDTANSEPRVLKGKRTADCPPREFRLRLAEDGDSFRLERQGKPDRVFVRPGN
ncbi:hypothetical protein [Streptomyces sp. NPDC005438]|uniref:hypothetical protein n=1 Tax=Streptomyces sp. NPDC005438 TaxID=3156880 RepID=UPI0033A3D60E